MILQDGYKKLVIFITFEFLQEAFVFLSSPHAHRDCTLDADSEVIEKHDGVLHKPNVSYLKVVASIAQIVGDILTDAAGGNGTAFITETYIPSIDDLLQHPVGQRRRACDGAR